MAIAIKELRERLTAIDIPVNLTAQTAESLKSGNTRERIIKALTRVESANDQGARTYLQKTLAGAGLLQSQNAASQTHTSPQTPPVRNNETQHPPQPTPRPQPTNAALPPALNDTLPASDHPNAPGNTPAPQSSSNAGQNGKRPYRPSHHVYGSKAAVMFELDETKAGTATIALDGARSIGERKYDWKDKVRIQMTASEVPVVAAVLFGIQGSCMFMNHGAENDKGFEIEWQGQRGSFFVKVWQGKGNMRSLPMTPEDAYHVGQIVLRALQQASPARLDATGALNVLKAVYARK